MGSHIVTCHPTQENVPGSRNSIYLPPEGWKAELTSAMHQPGTELAICGSHMIESVQTKGRINSVKTNILF